MAKNYTFGEAVEIIAKGEDMGAIADIGKRFPLMLAKVVNITAVASDAFVDLAKCFPENLTANKVNTGIKNLVATGVEDDEDEPEDEDVEVEKKETKKAKPAKQTKVEENDEDGDGLDAKTSKELYQMLKEKGLTKGRKFSKKSEMIEALRNAGVEAEDDEEIEDEQVEDEETQENPYEGKNAMTLFKECKKRKIKVAPKKPAKFYVEALLKDDAEKANEEVEDDDDWGDDEEIEEPKEKANKGDKKSNKKVETKNDDEDDDDEDWDI